MGIVALVEGLKPTEVAGAFYESAEYVTKAYNKQLARGDPVNLSLVDRLSGIELQDKTAIMHQAQTAVASFTYEIAVSLPMILGVYLITENQPLAGALALLAGVFCRGQAYKCAVDRINEIDAPDMSKST